MTDIPTTMRAISLSAYHPDKRDAVAALEVVERPVPQPKHGEVLVRMIAAPCNPSDLMLLQDAYGVTKSLPCVPGWEGAGTVVGSGGGLMARVMQGQTVACGGQGDFDGTWAEYFVAEADSCIPLIGGLDPVQGSTLIVNPVTALAMIDTARDVMRSPALINLAAASQLGRMVVELAKGDGYPVINVVRRPAQIELLESLGAEHVLLSTDDDHDEKLAALAKKLDARVALDPIAGPRTGRVLRAMPNGSRVLVYGALSGEPCADIDPLGLIFEDKHVTGFWLTQWIATQSLPALVMKTRALQKRMRAGQIRTEVQAHVGFDDSADALAGYLDHITAGTVILAPTR
ncbi:MAG: zinc-binding dehydrogenase [Polyangiaceae bacterium]